MVKLQQIPKLHRWHITVPSEIVFAKKWHKSQRLAFVFNERGNVELIEVPETETKK